MSHDYGARRGFDLGRVIERTFGAIGANGLSLFLVSLIFVGLPQAGLVWLQSEARTGLAMPDNAFGMTIAVGVLALVVSIVCNVIMQGVVTHSVVADLQRRKASLGESLGAALGSFWVLLAVGIIAGLAMTLGLILLVIPGILIFLVWMVAGPVVVAEGAGVGRALQRSRDLTRNHRWWLLLLSVVYVLVSWIIGAVVSVLGISLAGFQVGTAFNIVTLVIGPLTQAVSTLLWSAIVAATYVELRSVKEGGGQSVASIFD